MKVPVSDAPRDSLALESRRVHHWFGEKRVLADVNLKILRGQFLSLVGPSGCGKSTFLRAILGTHLPRQGEILLFPFGQESRGVAILGPGRDRGIVYQHYSLFPFLTAQENVAIGLSLDRTSFPFRLFCFPKWRRLRKRHMEEAADFLAKVKLADAICLYPHEMSGGMRQRVAIAQALILKPEIILLDEPFGALDEATREELQRMLLALHAENQEARRRAERPSYTLMLVTHELNEAIYVGDRVVGLSQHWDWKSEGYERFPGATIVYDKPAPVYEVKSLRDFELFAGQREEIRRTVFEPPTPTLRGKHVVYWSKAAAGDAPGVTL
jgi:NitT/TauT family transport system ATP-binding protein